MTIEIRVLALVCCVLHFTIQKNIKFAYEDEFFLEADMSNKSIHLKFSAEQYFAEHSLTISFLPYSNLVCPQYTAWFKKDSHIMPCFSFAAVCDRFETHPAINLALAKDWHRSEDRVANGYWTFDGLLDYEGSDKVALEDYGIEDINEVRVRSNSSRTESIDFTYYVRSSTIVLN